MIDWEAVRALAAQGLLVAEIAARVGYTSHPSNLAQSAKRRGIGIRTLSFQERAGLAGRKGGRKPKRRYAERTAEEQRRYEYHHEDYARRWEACKAPPPCGPVFPAIKRMLEP